MNTGLVIYGQILEYFREFWRRRNIRVAEAEIKNIVSAVLGLHSRSFLEHFSDPGGFLRKLLHFLCYGHKYISL
jgi:hypothetical protein